MTDQVMDDVFGKGEPVALKEPEVKAQEPQGDVVKAEVTPEPAKGELATPPVAQPKADPVPIQALLDERDRRQKYEREAAELREKLAAFETAKNSPPPDLYVDPEARLQFENQRFQQEMVNMKLGQSRFLAEREYGKEVVDAAFAYFDQHPQLSHQFLSEPSPFHAAVEFYKRQKVADEVGPDPEAYKKRLRDELEAQIRAEMANGQQPSPTQPARLPGSLAAAPAAGKTTEAPSRGNAFDAAFG